MSPYLGAAALAVLVSTITLPAAFAGPSPDPAPEAVLATLPFLPSNEVNRVVVDLAPPGAKPLRLMLDTGAAGSVLTPGMARELGVTVRRTKSSPYRRSTVLGRDLQFYVDTKGTDTGSRTGWEYGVLGGDFLDHYVVELDFPGRRVRFLDPKKYTTPEGVDDAAEAVVPAKIIAHRILAPVELDGKRIDLVVDTGAPDTMVLSGAAAKQIGVDVAGLAPFGTAGTVLGPMEQRFYEAAEFRFGGFASSPFPVIVAPKGWYNLGMGNDSVIGYDVLRPFVVRIDYGRKRIWLRRTGDARVTFLGGDYAVSKKVGAFLVPYRGSLVAYHVTPEGPAARYGLREGDAIVPPAGETLPAVEDVAARIEKREELTVARRTEGDIYVDMILPAEAAP
jgi:predicted aspartyl protease